MYTLFIKTHLNLSLFGVYVRLGLLRSSLRISQTTLEVTHLLVLCSLPITSVLEPPLQILGVCES